MSLLVGLTGQASQWIRPTKRERKRQDTRQCTAVGSGMFFKGFLVKGLDPRMVLLGTGKRWGLEEFIGL